MIIRDQTQIGNIVERKPNESQNEKAGITWGFNHRKSEGSGGYEINIIVGNR